MNQKTLNSYIDCDSEPEKEPCPTCGDLFSGVAAHHWQAHGEKLRVDVKCDHCGKPLQRPPEDVYDTNFCNEDHMYAYQTGENHHNYNSRVVECDYGSCEETLERAVCTLENGENNFHSRDCYAKWLEGNFTGQGHPLWRGGVSTIDGVRKNLAEQCWQNVAEDARKHHGRVCQNCGVPESVLDKKLDVHHIVPLVCGGDNGDYNLIPLCDDCHTSADWFIRDIPEIEPVLVE